MKTTKLLSLLPIVGLLSLTACKTTSNQSASPGETPRDSEPAQTQAAPAVADTGNYLVTLVKKAPGMVSVGDTFPYELTATAQSDVADTTIVDAVPTGASYVSSEPPAMREGGKLTWKLGDMGRGESKSIKVMLKAESQGQLTYCATVSAVPRVCVVTMVGRAQLALKKTGPELAQLGSNVTYNITVQNTGNTVARNVVVTDPVPDGFRSADGARELSFSVGDLDAGASKPFQVTLQTVKRGRFCNKAFANSSNAGKAESEACTTVVQGGIKITKVTNDKELFVNRTATYNIQVVNTGDFALTGVVVTDTAAPETVIAVAEGASVSGNTATWNLGTLAAGAKKDLAVKILSKVPGRFCDTASVVTSEGLRDSAQDCSVWRGVTGVLLEMVDDPDPIQVGETSKYTIRVTNQGSTIDITELDIVATLPPELEVVPGTVSDGGTANNKTITWPRVSRLAPKESVVRTYVAKGLKAGDARSKVAITTAIRKDPIEKFESTTVY